MLRKPEPEVTAPGEAGMEGRQASELTGLNPTESDPGQSERQAGEVR